MKYREKEGCHFSVRSVTAFLSYWGICRAYVGYASVAIIQNLTLFEKRFVIKIGLFYHFYQNKEYLRNL